MEASARLLTSTAVCFHRRNLPLSSLPLLNANNPRRLVSLSLGKCSLRSTTPFPSSPNPFSSPLSRISPSPPEAISPNSSLNSFEGSSIQWDHPNFSLSNTKGSVFSRNDSVLTVVLLGWLGAKQKHLKRYADMYNLRGIQSVRFVVPPTEFLGFDLGSIIEEKVKNLAHEIGDWCSVNETDGRERHLLFHTFSNTGWLAYGVILDNLKSREDIIRKIRGCIVDSGPCAEISPEVWAAGFCAAFLKKRTVLQPPAESPDSSNLKGSIVRNYQSDTKPSIGEMVLLPLLTKFFEVLLRCPDVNRRLSKYISVLSENQPHCPQLYLYSSADKVIPPRYVEEFIAHQKALGRTVYAHNFGLSPHVDHFRSYPHLYTAKVEEFLKLCSTAMVS
ncbi:hypothetical protein LUZ63_004163 [Rhynchospora breviuscula]|uniref:Transmembrane protein 53 n=1 Tax=Rhynchospora breviuscula TaxID=2022672 RepID=A0A9Q0HZE3_9POAL|nr:hypothetical protein LUZ63_004163 [Rhynchospora breviuscula]